MAATAILRETGDITMVKNRLGDTNISTSMNYAQARKEAVQKAVNKAAEASPWGKKGEVA